MSAEAPHLAPAPRRRGRPLGTSNAYQRAADEAIGRTVWQLMAWGCPLRRSGGVLDVVASVARDQLGRTDHTGRLPLSADRIEQIFEGWLKTATYKSGWVREGKSVQLPYTRIWAQTTLRSLALRRPSCLPLSTLAARLLANGGHWQSPARRRLGDLEPTASGWAKLQRMPKVIALDETG